MAAATLDPVDHIGCRFSFRVRTNGNKFDGRLLDVDDSGGLSVYEMADVHEADGDARELIYPTMKYDATEIRELELVSSVPELKTHLRKKTALRKMYMLTKEEFEEMGNFVDIGNMNLTEQKQIDIEDVQEYTPWTVEGLEELNSVMFIDFAIDDEQLRRFWSALYTLIEGQQPIGIAAHGKDMSRTTGIEVMSVALLGYGCFVFKWTDAAAAALSDFLEDENALKIVYHCSGLSDALYHCHQISLAGIMDVVAFDCAILSSPRTAKGARPEHPEEFRSLEQLIEAYVVDVDIEPHRFKNFGSTEEYKCIDSDMSIVAENFVRRECAFLIPIYWAELETFYAPVTQNCLAMLTLQRDAKPKEFSVFVKQRNNTFLLHKFRDGQKRKKHLKTEAEIYAACAEKSTTEDSSSISTSPLTDEELRPMYYAPSNLEAIQRLGYDENNKTAPRTSLLAAAQFLAGGHEAADLQNIDNQRRRARHVIFAATSDSSNASF